MDALKDDDLFLVNREGIDYKVSFADIRNYVEEPHMPWERYNAIFHIKNPTKDMVGNWPIFPKRAWDIDGTNEREITSIPAGEELVFAINISPEDLLAIDGLFLRMDGTWDFGELTDTSRIASFNGLFTMCYEFNGNVSNIDTSNATHMTHMFHICRKFNNESIKDFDTSKVVDMSRMFEVTDKFDVDISNWDVSNVENMEIMFSESKSFNQDLSKWCVSSVTNHNAFDNEADRWEDKHKPVWGTCPS
jgi:surface protein